MLRELSARFLDFVVAKTEAGHLSSNTKKYYHFGWKLLEGTRLAGMRIDQIGTSDASVISFPHGPAYANRPFELCAGCCGWQWSGRCYGLRPGSRRSKSMGVRR